jgi:hypothetical protein
MGRIGEVTATAQHTTATGFFGFAFIATVIRITLTKLKDDMDNLANPERQRSAEYQLPKGRSFRVIDVI